MPIAPNAGNAKGRSPRFETQPPDPSFRFTEGVIHRSHPKLPHFIALILATKYFSRFQPRNRMSSPKTTRKSANSHITNQIKLLAKVHFSYLQSATLKTVDKNKQAPPGYNHRPGLSY
jgi:hypothetical protein